MSQSTRILKHLQSGKSITDNECRELHKCNRLAARICELRKDHDISKEMVTQNGKTFARYSIKPSFQLTA